MSLGDHTQVRTQEIELVPVFMFSKQRHRRKFTVVFVLVVKKSALDVQNLLFFHLLIGLIAVAVTIAFVVAPRIYRCASTVRNPNTVSVNTPAIFSLDIYVIKIRSINELLRFSGNPHLRGEGKKVSCFRKNTFPRNNQS